MLSQIFRCLAFVIVIFCHLFIRHKGYRREKKMKKVLLFTISWRGSPNWKLNCFWCNSRIKDEIRFYRSQLGIPEEGSERFAKLRDTTQQEDKAISSTMASASQIGGLIAAYASEQAAVTRYIPFVGFLAAGVLSLGGTYLFSQELFGKGGKSSIASPKRSFWQFANRLSIYCMVSYGLLKN